MYSCAVTERWLSRIKNVEGVSTTLLYKLDQQLFHRSTSRAEEFDIDECRFADDVASLATSHAGTEEAIRAYCSTTAGLELSVSFIQTKFLVAEYGITKEDKQPIVPSGGNVECVSEFCMSRFPNDIRWEAGHRSRKMCNCCIQATGALRCTIFQDRNLLIMTKRFVYQACILSVLLCGGECWATHK